MAMALPNEWLKPIHVFAPGEDYLRKKILKQVPDYRIPDDKWEEHTRATDGFLDRLGAKITDEVKKYSGEIELTHGGFVKQASSRQGLKISAPNEYDILLPFRIQGLGLSDFQRSDLKDPNGKVVPDLSCLIVQIRNDQIKKKFPKLADKGVFFTNDHGTTYIHTKNFLERVWIQIVDKAVSNLKKDLPQMKIDRRNNPPAINIQTIDEGNVTDFDVVPALLENTEEINIPAAITGKKDRNLNLEIFGLLKYDNHNRDRIKENERTLVWRNDTSSHERYMADLCRSIPERQYIMTANRILKAVIMALEKSQIPLGQLISSYHLKTIAYHCVLRLTMMRHTKTVDRVKDALGYQISYLDKCVREKNLPDFFYGNKHIDKVFPGSVVTKNGREVNLFWKENEHMVENAVHGMCKLRKMLVDCYTTFEEKDVAFLFK